MKFHNSQSVHLFLSHDVTHITNMNNKLFHLNISNLELFVKKNGSYQHDVCFVFITNLAKIITLLR
jgi:uncharacterized membrane protein YwzB